MSRLQAKFVTATAIQRGRAAELALDCEHYLRQATITRRRESSWLNQAWNRHHQATPAVILWKH